MKICLCYLCVTHGRISHEFAARFAATYHEYPPGVEHDTLVICNGGPLKSDLSSMFFSMSPMLWPRANDGGWDISAYMAAARGPCAGYDMMLCLGESNYFHRQGWLKRIADAWQKYGPGMYGPYSSNAVRAHLNTTAFASAPGMIAKYPAQVTNRAERYQFEHGERSFWRRLSAQGRPVRLVTWDGEWEPRLWRFPQNILWRGDQTNCLMWCNHSDGYSNANLQTKKSWMRNSDQAFK